MTTERRYTRLIRPEEDGSFFTCVLERGKKEAERLAKLVKWE